MRRISILPVVAFTIIVFGCNTDAERMAYGEVCAVKNEKKSIITEGYLDDLGRVFCSNTSGRMECGFKLKKEISDKQGFSADIAVGSGANSMDELGSGYKRTDITIRNNDGNVVDLGKKIRLTGTLSAYETKEPAGVGCFLQVYKIEQ